MHAAVLRPGMPVGVWRLPRSWYVATVLHVAVDGSVICTHPFHGRQDFRPDCVSRDRRACLVTVADAAARVAGHFSLSLRAQIAAELGLPLWDRQVSATMGPHGKVRTYRHRKRST